MQMLEKQALETITSAHNAFGDRLVAFTSLGKNSGLLMKMIQISRRPIRIVFLNPGNIPAANVAYGGELERALGITIEHHENHSPLDGGDLADCETDLEWIYNRRKVACLREVVEMYGVCAGLFGARRDQSDSRTFLPVREQRHGIVQYRPLADWPQDFACNFFIHSGVPIHPAGLPGRKTNSECGLIVEPVIPAGGRV